jgi:calcium permeable stress-gated cation channel
MMIRIFVPIWFVSWAVLLPVDSVNTHVSGHSGVERFTLGNIERDKQVRLAAHIILAYLFTCAYTFNFRLCC